jgi:hypothetical protein
MTVTESATATQYCRNVRLTACGIFAKASSAEADVVKSTSTNGLVLRLIAQIHVVEPTLSAARLRVAQTAGNQVMCFDDFSAVACMVADSAMETHLRLLVAVAMLAATIADIPTSLAAK